MSTSNGQLDAPPPLKSCAARSNVSERRAPGPPGDALRTPFVVWGEEGAPGPRRPALAAQRSSAAQHPTLALPHGDALGVEVLHQRDRILAGDAEEVLHVARADLLLLLEI